MAQRPPDPEGVRRTEAARDRQTEPDPFGYPPGWVRPTRATPPPPDFPRQSRPGPPPGFRAGGDAEPPPSTPRGGGNLGGGNRDPLYVHITGAERDFYDGFRSPGATARPGSEPGQVSGVGFEALLSQQGAIAEEARRAMGDMRLAAEAARQFGSAQSAAFAAQAQNHREDRVRIDEVLTRIAQTLQQVAQDVQDGRQAPGGAPPPERRPAPPSEPIRGQQEPQDLTDLNGGAGPLGPVHGPELPPGHRRRSGGSSGTRSGSTRSQDLPEAPSGPPAETDYNLHLGRGHLASRRASHGQIQRRMRSQVGRAVHERWGLGTTRSPTITPVLDEQGNTTHYERHHPDGTRDQVETNDPALPGMLRGRAVQSTVSEAAGAFGAEGAGAAARVGLDAIPYVGEVAMAVQAAVGVGQWVGEQRKENAKYQQIYGGSNWEGLGQRIQEYGYGFGQSVTGGRTQGDATQMFQGVSQLGLSGSERMSILDADEKLYRKLGLSTAQSLQAITIAAQHSNTSLAGVSQALTSVSLSARATGQSADTLRQQFLNVFQQTSAAGLGPNAATAALAYTNADAGANRALGGVNYAGAMSDTYTRMAAAQNNMTPGALQASDAFHGTSLRNQFTDRGVAQAGQNVSSPTIDDAYNRAVAAKGGADKVQASQGAQLDIAAQVLAAGFDATNYQQQVLAATGIDIGTDPLANAQYYVDHRAGNTYTGEQNKVDATHKDTPLPATPPQKNPFSSTLQSPGEAMQQSTSSAFVSDNLGGLDFTAGGQAKHAAVQAYGDWQQTSKVSDPAIEQAIEKFGSNAGQGVKIQTKDGDKVVSMADAIKYAPDQVAHGTAILVGGTDDGASLQTKLGFSDTGYQGPDTTKNAAPEGSTDVAGWKKNNPTDAAQAQADKGTNVQITMSDDLKRWFGVNVNGAPVNPSTESGAGAGLPPAQTVPGGH